MKNMSYDRKITEITQIYRTAVMDAEDRDENRPIFYCRFKNVVVQNFEWVQSSAEAPTPYKQHTSL